MSCLWLRNTDPYFDLLGASTEAEKDRLNRLVSSAVSFVERYCRRSFSLAEYDEVYTVARDGSVFVRNFPVSAVYRVCSGDLGVLTLANSTAVFPSWATTDTALTLRCFVAGVAQSSSLTLADSPTLATLATAVSAVGSGWSASVDANYGNHPSAEIVPQQHGSGSTSTLYLWDSYTGDFSFNGDTGVLTSFPAGSRVRVVYQGGYSVVPEDLREATANLVVNSFSGEQVASESLGEYSYSLADVEKATKTDRQVLSYYRDRGV